MHSWSSLKAKNVEEWLLALRSKPVADMHGLADVTQSI